MRIIIVFCFEGQIVKAKKTELTTHTYIERCVSRTFWQHAFDLNFGANLSVGAVVCWIFCLFDSFICVEYTIYIHSHAVLVGRILCATALRTSHFALCASVCLYLHMSVCMWAYRVVVGRDKCMKHGGQLIEYITSEYLPPRTIHTALTLYL